MKHCKGQGKTKGYGCNRELPYTERNGLKSYKAKYGIGYDCGCLGKWLTSGSPGAKETIAKARITGKNNLEKEKRKETRRKKDELNTGKNMRLADMYFSRYIRLKHSKDGFCTCYTSGEVIPIKEIDNGHYQKREHKATRYHENNCRPQSKKDNGDTRHNGKQTIFRENLVREIGEEKVAKIDALARSSFKMTALDYKRTADYYREKLNELQKELGVKYW